MLKVGILTSNGIRHRYFADAIGRACEVAAVCYQETGYSPRDTDAGHLDAATVRILKHHFDERTRQEAAFFGPTAKEVSGCLSEDQSEGRPSCSFEGRTGDLVLQRETASTTTTSTTTTQSRGGLPPSRVLDVTTETLNTETTMRFLRNCQVDVVVVYGTSLITEPLLSAFGGRMINMHLGLSPYYRGTATNFYPLVNDEPEYVGATIHMLDAGIDSGDIIHHARPTIVADDMPHTIGCKAILAGIEKVIQALQEMEAGTMRVVPQWKPANARLYLRKHYKPAHVVQLYRMIEDGLFPKYVAREEHVADKMRLIP